ncbi:DUF2284 domain-containing protein [Propionibacterium australiense]|uniref:Metal-binding protein n=1 Tax=Propionibacterium australiense TaxID=119981 RepID=A0A8B3FUM5_9ACTN|nr:DUF2284 domain-containing protein [Propionibacterium australiense]RLP12912.1 hypothetical protein D7U36_00300 [Propionibacterium australiense]
MLDYAVHDEQRTIDTAQCIERFVDVPRFLEYCRGCPAHGRTWACPEFDFDPLGIWTSRQWFHVITRTITFGAEQRGRHVDPDDLRSQVIALFAREKRRLRHRLVVLRAGHPGAVPLLAGSCELCERCTRLDGRPCARPEHLMYSIESIGGDVVHLVRELFGIQMQWSDGTRLPEAYHLTVGLLSDEPVL